MTQLTIDQIAPDFSHARAALARYDATWEERAIAHNADMAAWRAADKAAADEVRRAFFEATSDRNRLDTVMSVSVESLRKWIA